MRMRSWLMGLLAVVLAGIVGCANPLQGGEAVTMYQKGKSPLLMTAPLDGRYVLFSEMHRTPQATVTLKKGDPLGFKQADPGQITAVAGDQTFNIQDQTLIWRLRK